MEISWHLVVKMANLSHRPEKNCGTEMFLTERRLSDKDDWGSGSELEQGALGLWLKGVGENTTWKVPISFKFDSSHSCYYF